MEAKGFQSWFISNEWIEGLAWDGFIPTKKVMTACPGWRDHYKWSPSSIFRYFDASVNWNCKIHTVFVLHMQTAYQQLLDERGGKKHGDHLIQNVMVR